MFRLIDDAHSAFAELAQKTEVAKHATNPRIVAGHTLSRRRLLKTPNLA